jgi:hypothetical protein
MQARREAPAGTRSEGGKVRQLMKGAVLHWTDMLIDLICRLLKVVGGDCDQLEEGAGQPTPVAIIDEIERRYDPDNPPQPADNTQKAEWCTLFADIETHLDLPENDLPPASDATLRQIVDSLQGDVGC